MFDAHDKGDAALMAVSLTPWEEGIAWDATTGAKRPYVRTLSPPPPASFLESVLLSLPSSSPCRVRALTPNPVADAASCGHRAPWPLVPNDAAAPAAAPDPLGMFAEQTPSLPVPQGVVDNMPWEALVDAATSAPGVSAPLYLDLNDRRLLLAAATTGPLPAADRLVASTTAISNDPAVLGLPQAAYPSESALNLSNDKYYTEGRQKRTERVRYGANELALNHTGPALRLEYPLVRTRGRPSPCVDQALMGGAGGRCTGDSSRPS